MSDAADAAPPLILVVDDEPEIRTLVARTLAGFQFRVEALSAGSALLSRLRDTALPAPALCVLDLGLPDMDGVDLMRRLRAQAGDGLGILILTGRAEVPDRVVGLELGADDYVLKPFEPRELVARVRAILRRLGRPTGADNGAAGLSVPPAPVAATATNAAIAEPAADPCRARFAGWTLDLGSQTLTAPEGLAVSLSTAEAALLGVLLRSANRIVSRERLLGDRDRVPFDRSIDVRVSRLRRKLRDDPHAPTLIRTVYGAGYMLTAQVAWE